MILRELSEATGPSGKEREVRGVLREALQDHVDRTWVDTLGNLHAERRGSGRGRLRILLAAHMDEVSLMVTGHHESGALKVAKCGGIDDRVLPSTVVWVGSERIPGVIGLKPVHLQETGERDRVTKINNLAVDIGAKGKDEAKHLAPVGTYAVFATRFRELGATVMGKAFDDRAGCAVLVELMRGEQPRHDLVAVFTAQEEVGMRGARVAAYATRPDCAFALEGTAADDLPKKKDVSPTSELGKGPAITVMDRSFIAHRGVHDTLVGTADELGIPYQFKQPGIGGTDSGAIHLAREGVPCSTVAVPCRYIHSPVSILSLQDLEDTVRLMRETLMRLTRRSLRRD